MPDEHTPQCPLQLNDVIKSAAFRHAWRDGDTVFNDDEPPRIVDGRIWVCSQATDDLFLWIERRHTLTDAERVEVFRKTGKLGPKSAVRRVKALRRLSGHQFDRARVIAKPSLEHNDAWLVTVTQLDPTAFIGQPPLRFYFFLATKAADTSRLDLTKVIPEAEIFILPRPDEELFGSWATAQKEVRIPEVGHIVSGRELRWYMGNIDREAEYLIIGADKETVTISVCASSHNPRDCQDDWCGYHHDRKQMTVESGVRIRAAKTAAQPDTGMVTLVGESIEWFLSTDRDFSDSDYFQGSCIHIAGDRCGNFAFRSTTAIK